MAVQVGDEKDGKSPTEAEKVETMKGNNSERRLGSKIGKTSRMIPRRRLRGGLCQGQWQGLQTEPTAMLLMGRADLELEAHFNSEHTRAVSERTPLLKAEGAATVPEPRGRQVWRVTKIGGS